MQPRQPHPFYLRVSRKCYTNTERRLMHGMSAAGSASSIDLVRGIHRFTTAFLLEKLAKTHDLMEGVTEIMTPI